VKLIIVLLDSQETPSILWKKKVHYHVCKSWTPVPILSQMNPISTTKPGSPKIHVNIILRLFLGLLTGLLPTCLTHLILLIFITVMFGEEYKVRIPYYAVFPNLLSIEQRLLIFEIHRF
jgi:hypothetical protein